MCLVAHNRCWTADRVARQGIPHPERCPPCDQAPETINHLLVGCIFAREFWFILIFMTSGKGSAVTGVACYYMVLILLLFLGSGVKDYLDATK
jgi:hypothetical protein